MKIFALRDVATGAKNLAYLECYDNPRSFYFELPPESDPWELPFIIHEFVKRGHLTIGAAWSQRWVESRVVPPERQNLGEILRENGLLEYDELRLLELTGGRCSQDSCYLTPISNDALPTWYEERVGRRLRDAFSVDGFRLVLLFADGEVRICHAEALLGKQRTFARVIADEGRFSCVALQAGGHGICWGEQLHVSADELRAAGTRLGLSAHDLAHLASQAVCDTAEAMALLGCSRQNISDLVRRGKLHPLKSASHITLFLRSDVLARRS